MTPDELQQTITHAVYGPEPPTDNWHPWTWLGDTRRVKNDHHTARPEWDQDT